MIILIISRLRSLLDCIFSSFFDSVANRSESFVNSRLVLQEVWSDDFIIHDVASVAFNGSHQPDEEQALDKPVEWNNFSDIEREELDGTEAAKDDPVNKPFLIIGRLLRFHSLH